MVQIRLSTWHPLSFAHSRQLAGSPSAHEIGLAVKVAVAASNLSLISLLNAPEE